MSGNSPLRIVLWGTYDLGKPRIRILRRALAENGVEPIECHADVWVGVEDKSRLADWRERLQIAWRWLAAYPGLIWRYLRLPEHDLVMVGYLGHLDVLLLWPFAKLRGVPVVWDAFISLSDTVVDDRRLVSRWHPLALALYALDWIAARAADLVLLDTAAHAYWFEQRFGLKSGRAASVFVGAEPEVFAAVPPAPARRPGEPVRILFYGQFIPLHGLDTVIDAAMQTRAEDYRWTLIGDGQEAARLRRRLLQLPMDNLEWLPPVPYAELRRHIGEADICLGIFGTSGKAERVIPNKLFQALAAGRPVITRDSPAIRELVGAGGGVVRLVTPGSPAALLGVLDRLVADLPKLDERAFAEIGLRIRPVTIGRRLLGLLAALDRGTGAAEPERRAPAARILRR